MDGVNWREKSIDYLEIRQRARTALHSLKIKTLGEAADVSDGIYLRAHNCGSGTVYEIRLAIAKAGGPPIVSVTRSDNPSIWRILAVHYRMMWLAELENDTGNRKARIGDVDPLGGQ